MLLRKRNLTAVWLLCFLVLPGAFYIWLTDEMLVSSSPCPEEEEQKQAEQAHADSLSTPLRPAPCDFRNPDFPLFMSVLTWDPLVRIFTHSPKEDIWVSATVLNAQGRGGYFEASYSNDFGNFLRHQRKLRPQETPFFVDVGANIGLHALYLSSRGFDVEAFEPEPRNLGLLRCSQELNWNVTDGHLFVHQVALGDRDDGELCMEHVPFNRAHAYVVDCNVSAIDGGVERVRVPVRTLDFYWRGVWNKRRIDILKLDVEGYETRVVRGARDMMLEAPPRMIQAEYNAYNLRKAGANETELFHTLLPLGYRAHESGEDITDRWTYWVANALLRDVMNDVIFLYPLSPPPSSSL